jgi:hypothetical protein
MSSSKDYIDLQITPKPSSEFSKILFKTFIKKQVLQKCTTVSKKFDVDVENKAAQVLVDDIRDYVKAVIKQIDELPKNMTEDQLARLKEGQTWLNETIDSKRAAISTMLSIRHPDRPYTLDFIAKCMSGPPVEYPIL